MNHRRALRALLPIFALLWPLAAAQGGLPEEAAAALRAGQLAAAAAVATYQFHNPDQPLWREAIAQGERARELAPGRLEPLRFLAQVYGTTGWTSRTWEAWQGYMAAGGTMDARARSDAARAARVLGYQAFTAGAMGRARDLLEASYELDPEDLTTVTYLGQVRLETGDVTGAIPLLEAVVDTYPQLRPLLQRAVLGARHGLAAADAYIAAEREFAQGNIAGALSLFTAAMQGDPTFAQAIKGAAEVNAALGRTDEARRLWERALEADPTDAEVRAVLERIAAAEEAAAAAAQAAEEAQAAAEAAAAAQAAAEAAAPPVVLAPPPQQPAPVETPVAEPPAPEPAPEPVATPETPAEEPVATPPAQEPEPPVAEPEPQEPVAAVPPAPAPAPQPAPAPAGAPTITLVDATLRPRPVEQGGEGAFTFLEAPAAAVGDLRAYGQGTLHVQVELLEKPVDDPVLVQLCLVPDDLITVRPACSDAGALRLAARQGEVSASQNVAALDGAAAIDWSQGMAQVLIVLRDSAGRPLDARYAYDDQGLPLNVSAYYPMTLRVRAALVPAGGSFSGW